MDAKSPPPQEPPRLPAAVTAAASAPALDPFARPAFEHRAALVIVLGTLLSLFLAALDQTIVATALPTIARTLGDAENMAWVVTAYLLAATAVTPLYGKLSDIYGRRTMMLIGIGIYATGSLISALAPNMLMLIVGRAVQGLGGGGLMSLTQTIVGDVAPPRERPRFAAYTSSVFLFSTVGGPVVGGFVTEYMHWSLIFWLNLPLCAIAFVLSFFVLRRLPRHDRPHSLDIAGAMLMVGAALAIMLALTWGGRRYAWGSPQIVALLAGSAILWALFAWRMSRAAEPFIPLSVLRDNVVLYGTGASFFAVGVMIALTIFLPLYMQLALGLSIVGSGLAVIALQGAATLTSIGGGRLIARLAHYRRVPALGLVLAIVSLVPLVVLPAGLPTWAVIILIALIGFGMGPMFPFTIVVIQNAVALGHLGIATGVMNFFRNLGGTFIVALFGALVLAGIAPGTPLRGPAAVLAVGDPEGAFRLAFAAALICLVVALACVLAIEERPMRGAAE
jgi:EmrB/QacA subfamily drug resistance transporter